MARVGTGLLFAVAIAVALRASAGEPERVKLSFVRGEGAESCFAESELASRVKSRLGRDPFATDAPRTIEAVVTHDAHGFAARIFVRWRDHAPGGARDLASDAADCGPIEAAVTLAVALAIDPEAAMRPVAPVAPPLQPFPIAASSDVPPPAPPPPPPPPPAIEPATRSFGVLVAARLALDTGLLPTAAPGFAMGGELRAGRFVGAASAIFFPEQRTSDDNFGFGLAGAQIGACAEPFRDRPRFAVAACFAMMFGVLHAVPYVFVPQNPGEQLFVGLTPGARLELHVVGPLVAVGTLDAVIPASRGRFVVEGLATPVFQQPAVGAMGSFGLGFSL